MGVTSSRIEDDKALLLCRERKHCVRQALDGRCALAAAHVSYIQSLKNTGMAIRKYVEPEVTVESSLCTSTSATPEALALTEKSASQFSNSSPSLSQHVEGVESVSPLPSPYSGRFQVNYMKSNGNFLKTVEERPPLSVTATLHTSSDVSPKAVSHSDEASTFEDASLSSGTPQWDFFGLSLFHPIDNQLSFHDGRALNYGVDDIRRLREEEGIPELEEEEEKTSLHGTPERVESEDEFDETSSEPLVRIFKNRNQEVDSCLANRSSISHEETMPMESEQTNEDKTTFQDGTCETVGAPDLTPVLAAPSMVMPLINGKTEAEKEHASETNVAAKDLFSSVREIESLFLKAFESGMEVPRMLEANKVKFRPLFSEGKEQATDERKYLTWHTSVSSRSSSSRNPIGAALKDDIEGTSSTHFSSICMNSGSHASTLDRLYAWERKLYDEVRISGIICRDYDMKCKLLRHQESKGENPYRIDKTRAAVKDLHSRIRVAIQRIDSISKIIEALRDKELQPQLEELIGGLSRMWGVMLECHKLQFDIISVACNNGNSKVLMQSDYRRQAAILLEYELNGLNSSLNKWMAAHKSYLRAIYGWLVKCVFPVKQSQKPRKRNTEFSPWGVGIAPPIFVTCRHWLDVLEQLPLKDITDAIKRLAVATTNSLPHQDKNNRNSRILFSSLKIGRSELSDDDQMHEDQVDRTLCLDTWQKDLKSFLGQFKTFADASVEMYGNLGQAIEDARNKYEKFAVRPQMPSTA
uniref:Histidine ammonia-lyase n=1 Tax=Anthurium amnicola TaxID=1678845 RepID=A0A1D1XEW1_9ARAE